MKRTDSSSRGHVTPGTGTLNPVGAVAAKKRPEKTVTARYGQFSSRRDRISAAVAADPHNVRERLWQAVNVLATSARPLQERLGDACMSLVFLGEEDFEDSEGRARFTAILETSGALPASGDEGRIAATVLRMSDEQAVALAQQIVALDAHYRPPFDL